MVGLAGFLIDPDQPINAREFHIRRYSSANSNCVDTVDGPGRDPRPFSYRSRSRSLGIFMTKNPNSSVSVARVHLRRHIPISRPSLVSSLFFLFFLLFLFFHLFLPPSRALLFFLLSIRSPRRRRDSRKRGYPRHDSSIIAVLSKYRNARSETRHSVNKSNRSPLRVNPLETNLKPIVLARFLLYLIIRFAISNAFATRM